MDKLKKLFFIYNPHAGKGMLTDKIGKIVEIFTGSGYEVTVRPTRMKGEGIFLAENLDNSYDMIVASGGDGTLDELATGLLRRKKERRPPVGYIPSGSTNDFGNSLMIPRNVSSAARMIMEGEVFPCDMGRFNESHVFVYVAAFGLFTDIPYITPQKTKNALGHLAYVLEGAKALSEINSYHMTVTCDDRVVEGDFLDGMVTNSRSIGGAPNLTNKHSGVAFDDGLLEVTLIRTPKNPLELQSIINALLIENLDSEFIVTLQARRVVFDCDREVAWTMDGEDGGSHRQVRIRVDEAALNIMVPREALKKISCRTPGENLIEDKMQNNTQTGSGNITK